MKRVLFVDDDQNILTGLRRVLRSRRGDWEMFFANSGAEGLTMLADTAADVVVSDMKMPGMDGVAFLTEVKRLYPETTRLILSGHADRHMVMRSLGCSNQYLSKPCAPDELAASITRAERLQDLLQQPAMSRLVGELDTIPSVPALYQSIVELLQDPNSTFPKVGALIEQDPGISAKLLQVVNSCYFGLRSKAQSATAAVSYLGMETILALVLGEGVVASFSGTPAARATLDRVWRQSFITACHARTIARLEGSSREVADAAFTAGVLSCVGSVVVLTEMPERWAEMEARVAAGEPRAEAETAVYGVTAQDLSCFILHRWGIPDSTLSAVRAHRAPVVEPGGEAEMLVLYLHVAWAIAASNDAEGMRSLVQDAYVGPCGQASRCEAWDAHCREMEAA